MTPFMGRSHPTDVFSRNGAHTHDSGTLTEAFDEAMENADLCWRAGHLEVTASLAIARVALLERQLAEQEDGVRAKLFQRTGHVENVVPIKRDAPTRRTPLGA